MLFHIILPFSNWAISAHTITFYTFIHLIFGNYPFQCMMFYLTFLFLEI